MQDDLTKLELKNDEKRALPLGYSEIFIKKIFPDAIEQKLKIYSKKYNKLDFGFSSPKPISKILKPK